MAKSAKQPKEFKHDDTFPLNVHPSEENRKAWTDEVEADRKAREKGKNPEPGPRMGGNVVKED